MPTGRSGLQRLFCLIEQWRIEVTYGKSVGVCGFYGLVHRGFVEIYTAFLYYLAIVVVYMTLAGYDGTTRRLASFATAIIILTSVDDIACPNLNGSHTKLSMLVAT
eukprot:scaffold137822_cov32-Prasinocladus_malaysianus.AAC.2